MNEWAVYRLDYNANEFLVEKGLGKEQAEELAKKYIEHGHHQHYWVDKQPDSEPDFNKLLDEMLGSGSSINASVRVLLFQGASKEVCVSALRSATQMPENECAEIVQKAAGDMAKRSGQEFNRTNQD